MYPLSALGCHVTGCLEFLPFVLTSTHNDGPMDRGLELQASSFLKQGDQLGTKRADA